MQLKTPSKEKASVLRNAVAALLSLLSCENDIFMFLYFYVSRFVCHLPHICSRTEGHACSNGCQMTDELTYLLNQLYRA
jgi:hypothetical protein